MDKTSDQQTDWLRVGLLAFFWILALAALGFGLSLFLYAVAQWLEDGAFVGLDGFFDGLIGFIGAGVAAGGLLASGVLLRFTRLSFAPTASLVVAVLSTALVMSSYLLFADLLGPDAAGPRVLLVVAALVCLVVLAVPPFLHWRSARTGGNGGNP